MDDFRTTLLHELQHGVQAHELTSGGSNVNWIIQKEPTDDGDFKWYTPDPILKPEVERLNYLEDLSVEDPEFFAKHNLDLEYHQLRKDINRFAFNRYQANSGEIEARAAASLDQLSPEEKQDTLISELKRFALNKEMDKYRGLEMPTNRMSHPVPKYAEGGTVMDQKTDPVSGNEVPLGAKPEEVRDDVPIMASEGEYVIPANVVRFYGVNHFEKLIKKAQEGLAEMKANGRMGEEDDPSESEDDMDEDDLPLTDEELMGATQEVPQMAEGGMVPDTFDPAQFATGFSTFNPNIFANKSGTGIQNKIYINPVTGERRVIMFMNGVPVQQIPKGYVEDTPENKKTPDQIDEELKAEWGLGGGKGDYGDQGAGQTADWAGMTPEGRENNAKAGRDFAGTLAGIAVTAATGNPALGALAGRATKDFVGKQQAKEMNEQNVTPPTSDKSAKSNRGLIGNLVDRLTKDGFSSSPSGVSDDIHAESLAYAAAHNQSTKDVEDQYDPYAAGFGPPGSGPGDDGGDDGAADSSGGFGGYGGDNRNKGGLILKRKSTPAKQTRSKGLVKKR